MGLPTKNRKFISLFISVLIHGVLAYFLITTAVDYFVPEGVVTTIEFSDAEISKGTTDGQPIPQPAKLPELVEKKPKPKPVPPKPKKEIAPVVADKGEIEAPAKTLPDKKSPSEQEAPPELTAVEEEMNEPETADSEDTLDEEVDAADAEIPEDVPTAVSDDPGPSAEEIPPQGLPDKADIQPEIPPPAGMHGGLPLYRQGQLRILKDKQIKYPTVSAFMKEQGTVWIRGYFDGGGELTKIEVFRSSGYERLDEAAISGVKPMKVQSIGQPLVYEFGVKFQLQGEARQLENRALERYKKSRQSR